MIRMNTEIMFEARGAILVITFNRPEKGNALTPHMARTLCDKLKSVAEDRALRAVVLRGQGDVFMDGHEMSVFNGDTNSLQEQMFQKVQYFYTTIREIHAMERPVISAVSGRVSGAGFCFMLASDLVIAAQGTVFNTGFIPYAMVPDGGTTFFLPRKVGLARATELLLLSEDFSTEKAEEWGLINRTVPGNQLHEQASAWAEKLATGPTRIMGATKRLIGTSFEKDLNAQLSLEANAWNAGFRTFDFREAIKALAAKRLPKYLGS
jgi:2-(1,2-epoxy-1,2-dihydrophenyl)acetyl-CoA isomerase